ncbi:MAG: hypothetical protein RBT42_04705 [Aquabacterium sp.]|jgi:hypothetical protein|uniref:hypothetical protein n=1 Tax=Aquabacterium sp. TaxID=1872578 RepID=UPI002A35D16D|nr:hypothetical protein [Aquabacterium sp.]MDX9843036.1 hypothetical protein [Aquabacterium sp.]
MTSASIRGSASLLPNLNRLILRHIRAIEMVGVLMPIGSFSLVRWVGATIPFLFVWAFSTVDAILLSWCATLKRDATYSLLNVFWILVGVVGMWRASDMLGY